MYNYTFYIIETLTNTHVGSGEAGFGIIDNTIQRDPNTGVPIFQASGIKGALRNFFEEIDLTAGLDRNKMLEFLFGSSDNESHVKSNGEKKIQQGMLSIHEARLLFLPLRAQNVRPYYMATAPMIWKEMSDYSEPFCIPDSLKTTTTNLMTVKPEASSFAVLDKEPIIEGLKGKIVTPTQNFDMPALTINKDEIAVFDDSLFSNLCLNNIPVIERNLIGKNGTSENKFNEEVLPRHSYLWFMVGVPKDQEIAENPYIVEFKEKMAGAILQIGANASIGYGLCRFKEVPNAQQEH